MTRALRAGIVLALLAAAVDAGGAQSIFDSEWRLAPQFVQYRIKAGVTETTSEFAVPVFVRVPLGSSFTFDVGTAYAHARLVSGSSVSEIDGPTDTQVRGNLTLGSDFLVFTGGVNLPTGRTSISTDQIAAAGRIGSDFLAFPISSMGTGFGYTGGVAVARPVGDWNLGFGGAVRHATAYEPFGGTNATFHYQPGDEYRARVGVDHPLGYGRFSLGLTYSRFGDDAAGGSVYNTGDRLLALASATNSFGQTDIIVSAYDLLRGAGSYGTGQIAGRENIANAYVGLGVHALGTVVEPSVELRHWLQDVPGATESSSQSSYLATLGLRLRIDMGGLSFYPSAGYTVGQLATSPGLSAADMTGYRAQLAVRLGP